MKRKHFIWSFAAVGYVSLVSAAFMKSVIDGLVTTALISVVYSVAIYTTNDKEKIF